MTYQCDAACSCECSEREIARLRTELKEFCNAAADEMTRLRAELEQKDAELTNLKRDHESLVFLFNAHYGTEK